MFIRNKSIQFRSKFIYSFEYEIDFVVGNVLSKSRILGNRFLYKKTTFPKVNSLEILSKVIYKRTLRKENIRRTFAEMPLAFVRV